MQVLETLEDSLRLAKNQHGGREKRHVGRLTPWYFYLTHRFTNVEISRFMESLLENRLD